MIVDFHSHTRESDGTLAPRELVARMRKRGVAWFSITDHDTTRAYADVDAPGQRVVTGVEINTTWHGADVHVLGFRIPTGPSPIADVLQRNRDFRRRRIDTMLAGLGSAGYALTVDEVLAESPDGHALGRPHVAKALVRRGVVPDVQAAFDRLLSRGKPGYAPSNHITPLEAIDAIRGVGGVPVLAHPGRLKDERVINALAEHGLAGLEVFYPTHSTAQIAHYRACAGRLGLVMTAGSDFHDERWNSAEVGMEVDEADIRPFLDLVA